MKHRLSILLLAAGVALPAVCGEALSRNLFTSMLFEHLGTRSSACPEVVPRLGVDDTAVCARIDLTWKQLKKTTRSFLKQHPTDEFLAEVPWTNDRPYRTRYASTSDGMLRLVFDESDGWLALVPGHPCFDLEALETQGIQPADGERVTFPEYRQRARPEYPEAARINKSNGEVVLDILVLEDGRVGDVCVLFESRVGLGFGQSAAQAMSRSSFEPATKDGVAVPATLTTSVKFEIR